MSFPSRLAPRIRSVCRVGAISRPFGATTFARKQEEWPQRTPLGTYYESILNNPSPLPFEQKPEEPPNSADPEVLPEDKKPVEQPTPDSRPAKKKPGRPRKTAAAAVNSPAPSTSTSPPVPTPPAATAEEKARIVFGTRLASPDDKEARTANKQSQSTYIAGILVPPQPAEPDNCCMSGCVNCVWELYREDMEEWTAKKTEADARLSSGASSVGADGESTQENLSRPSGVQVGNTKIAKDLWDDTVFQNVPVGIREFMKQEKRLKERHEREGTSGG